MCTTKMRQFIARFVYGSILVGCLALVYIFSSTQPTRAPDRTQRDVSSSFTSAIVPANTKESSVYTMNDYTCLSSTAPMYHIIGVASSSMNDFLLNWWRSVKRVITPHHCVSVIALTTNVCNKVNDSRLNCIELPELLDRDKTQRDVEYQSAAYLRNVARKLIAFEYVSKIVNLETQIMFSDVDVVVLSDPFKYNLSRSSTGLWWSIDKPGNECNNRRGYVINSGVFFVRNSNLFWELVQDAKYALQKNKAYDKTDQGAFHYALQNKKIDYELLPCDKFCNGNAFWTSSLLTRSPITVHANWIVKSSTKRSCLQASGLWFGDNAVSRLTIRDAIVKLNGNQITRCTANTTNTKL